MTAAAIVLPMMPDLGLSSLAAVLAIGSGTLMGNHYTTKTKICPPKTLDVRNCFM